MLAHTSPPLFSTFIPVAVKLIHDDFSLLEGDGLLLFYCIVVVALDEVFLDF